jgi:Flp pilus assembly protein TadG
MNSGTVSRDQGSATIEMVLLSPVVMFLVLCVVFLGHRADATLKVQHAADIAARTASMYAKEKMASVAAVSASNDLLHHHQDCATIVTHLVAGTFGALRTVSVNVNCREKSQHATWLGIAPRTITASSTEVVDAYSFR